MSLDQNIFKSPILIVGLVRNGAKTLGQNVSQLAGAFFKFSEVHWLIVESDSDDGTVDELAKISKEVKNFRFLSQGRLSEKMPLRTERLAYCRNLYLQEIGENIAYKNID